MPGRASGVWRAALWNRTMEPGCTLVVTRSVISEAESSFQSRLSPSQTASRACAAALIQPAEMAGQQIEEFAVGGRGPQDSSRNLLQKHAVALSPAAVDHRSQVALHRCRGNPEFAGRFLVEPLRNQAEVPGIAPDALHHIGGGLEARQLSADAQGTQEALGVRASACPVFPSSSS